MKTRCEDCGFHCDYIDVLKAQNPFDVDDEVEGCPNCKAVNRMQEVCDEPDCWTVASCGFPTPQGYRHTCGAHYRPAQPQPAEPK